MTPPRVRGLVDKLERAVRMEIYAKANEKHKRKHDVVMAKIELLKAFAVISAITPSKQMEKVDE